MANNDKQLMFDLSVALCQPVSVYDGDLAHVGQSGELVQVPSLSLQLGSTLSRPSTCTISLPRPQRHR